MQNGKVVPSILLLVVLVSAGSWWYWNNASATTANNKEPSSAAESKKKHRGSGNGDNRPVPVLVASVQKGNIRVVQSSVGTVVPSAVVTVSSRVNGQLTRVLFKEGQIVHAGDLLAELDPRPFQVVLTQVQGQALRNQALLRNSQIDLDRYKTLQIQDSIASQQVDAQASLVQQYQGTVQADQGLVDNAKLQLSFTRITAPISGRIGLRQVDVGNNITTNNSLAVVNTVDPIQVIFTLPEDRVSDLVKRIQASHKSGKGLPVEAWDRSNSTSLAKGNLLSLDNQIDTTSGTVKLKAQFSNKENTLFPNQFVNVRLLSDTLHDVAVIPNAAIQHGSAGTFVYRIIHDQKDTKVTVQTIKLGTVDGDNVAVLEGLKAGDQVVISGIDKLRDNSKVKVSSDDNISGKEKHGRHEKSASKLDDRNDAIDDQNRKHDISVDDSGNAKDHRPNSGWKHRNNGVSNNPPSNQNTTAQ